MTLETDWQSRHLAGVERQVAHLRQRWPQAHYESPTIGEQSMQPDWLIVVPGVALPKGWTHWNFDDAAEKSREHKPATICTVLMPLQMYGETCGPLNGFYVDLYLRLADGAHPHHSRTDEPTYDEVRTQPDYEWSEFNSKRGGRLQYRRKDNYWQVAKRLVAERQFHWIAGHPQWRGITRFWWRVQHWNVNHGTAFTAAMVCRERLKIVANPS